MYGFLRAEKYTNGGVNCAVKKGEGCLKKQEYNGPPNFKWFVV